MAGSRHAQGLAGRLRREWRLRQLDNPAFGHLLDPPPPEEWVSLACEVTGHDPATDHLLGLTAVRVCGRKVLTSERKEWRLRPGDTLPNQDARQQARRAQVAQDGVPADQAMRQLLQFVGSRPLLGYYLEFDLTMLEPLVRPILGMGLPQEAVEVSALYHRYQFRRLPPYQQQEGAQIDLRLASMFTELGLPIRPGHQALDRAVLVALAFIKLRELGAA